MKVYLLMCLNDVIGDTGYTNEDTAKKLVDEANEETKSNDFWYQTIFVVEE